MDFLLNTLKELSFLVENLASFAQAGGWKYLVMWVIGGVLIYLAIRHDMEPTLLLPMGFGTMSGVMFCAITSKFLDLRYQMLFGIIVFSLVYFSTCVK